MTGAVAGQDAGAPRRGSLRFYRATGLGRRSSGAVAIGGSEGLQPGFHRNARPCCDGSRQIAPDGCFVEMGDVEITEHLEGSDRCAGVGLNDNGIARLDKAFPDHATVEPDARLRENALTNDGLPMRAANVAQGMRGAVTSRSTEPACRRSPTL